MDNRAKLSLPLPSVSGNGVTVPYVAAHLPSGFRLPSAQNSVLPQPSNQQADQTPRIRDDVHPKPYTANAEYARRKEARVLELIHKRSAPRLTDSPTTPQQGMRNMRRKSVAVGRPDQRAAPPADAGFGFRFAPATSTGSAASSSSAGVTRTQSAAPTPLVAPEKRVKVEEVETAVKQEPIDEDTPCCSRTLSNPHQNEFPDGEAPPFLDDSVEEEKEEEAPPELERQEQGEAPELALFPLGDMVRVLTKKPRSVPVDFWQRKLDEADRERLDGVSPASADCQFAPEPDLHTYTKKRRVERNAARESARFSSAVCPSPVQDIFPAPSPALSGTRLPLQPTPPLPPRSTMTVLAAPYPPALSLAQSSAPRVRKMNGLSAKKIPEVTARTFSTQVSNDELSKYTPRVSLITPESNSLGIIDNTHPLAKGMIPLEHKRSLECASFNSLVARVLSRITEVNAACSHLDYKKRELPVRRPVQTTTFLMGLTHQQVSIRKEMDTDVWSCVHREMQRRQREELVEMEEQEEEQTIKQEVVEEEEEKEGRVKQEPLFDVEVKQE